MYFILRMIFPLGLKPSDRQISPWRTKKPFRIFWPLGNYLVGVFGSEEEIRPLVSFILPWREGWTRSVCAKYVSFCV